MPRALHLIIARAAAGAVAALVLLSGSAQAEPVTLTARTGQFALTGELRAFDGEYYRIVAEYGPVTLSAAQVICDGAACPGPNETTGFAVTAAHGLGEMLLPALLQAHARALNLPFRRADLDPTHARFVFGADGPGERRFDVTVRLAVSGEGFADLAADEADLVLADRLISEDEAAMARDAGIGDLTTAPQERALAWDALAVVSSPRRERRPVTPEQVLGLWYSPDPDWAALGFAAGSVRLHGRAHGEDLAKLMPVAPGPTAPVVWHERGRDVSALVREQPGSLGLVQLSERGAAQALPLAGSCGLTHAPSRSEVVLGQYPWTLPLMLYLSERRAPRDLMDFLAFLETPEADAVLNRAGVVIPDGRPVPSDLPGQVFRALPDATEQQLRTLASLAARADGAELLAFTILPGALDRGQQALSQRSLDRLTDLAAEEDARLLLVAHADTRAQAEADARQVLIDFEQHGAVRSTPEILAIGAALPAACADDSWAAQMNRRIHVLRLPVRDTPRPEN